LIAVIAVTGGINAQNVGIGTATPVARLHIKGNADTSQLVIDAHSTQGNTRPLIKLRNSSGNDLLWIHSDNASNTFLGHYAGRINNATGGGIWNTFIGSEAGFSNSTGNANTANGFGALYTNSTGFDNTAIGYGALYSNSEGSNNTANGYYSLSSNTTGISNTANGMKSLGTNSTGNYNTASGVQSLYKNSTGAGKTANGYDALYSNAEGISNTASGMYALRGSSYGNYHTAVGYGTLYNTPGSQYNTAVGFQAGDSYNNGSNNVFIGANADVNADNYSNVIAVGMGTIAFASGMVILGNNASSSYRTYLNWSLISDGRYKKNVQENIPGLSFIMKLRPVTYNLMAKQLSKDLGENFGEKNERIQQELETKEQKIQSGFVAQEVEAAAKELGYDFSGVDKPRNEKDFYGLKYAEFVVPLVKGMQEQQAIIEEQNKKMKAMQADIEMLKAALSKK
jgi:hypothetical protein